MENRGKAKNRQDLHYFRVKKEKEKKEEKRSKELPQTVLTWINKGKRAKLIVAKEEAELKGVE